MDFFLLILIYIFFLNYGNTGVGRCTLFTVSKPITTTVNACFHLNLFNRTHLLTACRGNMEGAGWGLQGIKGGLLHVTLPVSFLGEHGSSVLVPRQRTQAQHWRVNLHQAPGTLVSLSNLRQVVQNVNIKEREKN